MPWSIVEIDLWEEFLLPVKGPPHDSWALMVLRMNEAAKQRTLYYRQFTNEIVKGGYDRQFPDCLPLRQKKAGFRGGHYAGCLKSLRTGWTFSELAKGSDQKLVARGANRAKFPLSTVTNSYIRFYGVEAVSKGDRFPQILKSSAAKEELSIEEQPSNNGAESSTAASGQSSTTTRSRYLTFKEMN